MAKSPTHPIAEPEPDHPGHPDHDLPGHGRPGHPDHDLPSGPGSTPGRPHPDQDLPDAERPQPKGKRAAKDVDAPATSVTRVLPPSAAIGDPNFVVRVIGTGFDATSVIVFAGEDEETTFVSPEEVTTVVNMDVWLGPDPAIPILVRTQTETGPEESNAVDFAFTPVREVPLEEAHASQPIPALDLITRM